MLPFFFIPNRNRVFLLYTMLQATYKDIKYTFNVTTKDVTILNPPFTAFLFRFTNDMSGAVKWSYGQNTVVRDRYTTVDFFHDTVEDIFTGKINFEPQGYWKYDVYQIPFDSTPVLDNCNTVNPTGINWNFEDSASTVLDTGTFDLYDYKKEDLTNALSPYNFNLYPACSNTYAINVQINLVDVELPKRFIHVDNITQTAAGMIVDIYSTASIGSNIEFYYAAVNHTINLDITAKPQNLSVFLPDLSPSLGGSQYTFKLYQGAALVDTYNPIVSETKPSGINLNSQIIFINKEYNVGRGEGTDKGSVFFTAQLLLLQTNYTYPDGTTFNDLRVEVGKLLVSEQTGEEQVRYKEHETAAGTNYIYNE